MKTLGGDVIKPQTYEWIDGHDDAAVTKLLTDDRWAMEQKLDGMRCMVRMYFDADQCQVEFLSHGGRRLVQSAAAQHFSWLRQVLDTRAPAPMEVVMEGELMTDSGVLWLFDLPYVRTERHVYVGADTPLEDRRAALKQMVDMLHASSPESHLPLEEHHVRMVPQVRGSMRKADLLQSVMDTASEGVVFKDLSAGYAWTGSRVRTVLKLKVKRTVDCVVTARNVGMAENVAGEMVRVKNAHLAVVAHWSGDLATSELYLLGSTSMNGKPDAKVGDVVEVEYLSWKAGGHLVQPNLLRVREDKLPQECLVGQLVPSNREILEVM